MRNGNRSMGVAAREVAEHASALTRLELDLALLEVKQKAKAFSLGIGLGISAGAFALVGLGFLWATIAVSIALLLPWWAALLAATAGCFLFGGIAAALAIGLLRHSAPPLPEKAIHEARLTTEAIRR